MTLRSQAIGAGRWTTLSSIVLAALKLLQVAVLARLLTPGEFGLMAVVASIIAVVTLVSDLGITRLVIQHRNLSNRVVSGLFWLGQCAAWAAALLLAALSPLAARLYGNTELIALIAVAGLAIPLTAAGATFRAIAAKDLRFAELAINEMSGALCGFVVAIVLAFSGAGVFALIGGVLASAATSSALAWLRLGGGYRIERRLSLGSLRDELRVGSYLVGDNVVAALNREADLFVGGAIVGASSLGLYSVPRDLGLRIANTVVNPVIIRIGMPVMSKAVGDVALLRKVYLATMRMTSSVNFPAYAFLGLFADDIVDVLYGSQWQGAGNYLRIAAAWGLLRSIGHPVGSLVVAAGGARRAFHWNLGLLISTPILMWAGAAQSGLPGLAWTMLAIQLLVIIPAWRLLVWPLCGASLKQYLGELAPAFTCTVAAGAFAFVASASVSLDVPALRLAFALPVMAALYMALSVPLNRTWINAMQDMLLVRNRKLPSR